MHLSERLARTLLAVGYRILRDDICEPTIQAVYVEGASSYLRRHTDILVVRVIVNDGAQQLEVA